MTTFSIIMAVKNRASIVGAALESLWIQSFTDFEVVVQDGVSTDGTVDYFNGLKDPRINFVSCSDNGIYEALNAGIQRSNGDIIGILHSDDFFKDENVLADVFDLFANDPDLDCVYGDLEYVAQYDSSRVVRHWIAREFSRLKLYLGWMPPHPTVFVRRSVFSKFGLYDINFRISGDYDFILRLFGRADFKSYYLSRVLVGMRLGGASNKSFSVGLRTFREDLRALKNNNFGGLFTVVLKRLRKVGQFFPS